MRWAVFVIFQAPGQPHGGAAPPMNAGYGGPAPQGLCILNKAFDVTFTYCMKWFMDY